MAPYIERAVESLFSQAIKDYEIIIVDDGSTDNLLEICEKWREVENVRIVHTENRDVSEARNLGLSIAKGEYVYFMDSDDWMEEGALSKVISLFEEGVDAVRIGYDGGEDDGLVSFSECTGHELLPKYIGYTRGELSRLGTNRFKKDKMLSYVWSFVFRRSVLIDNDIKFVPGLRFMEDKLFLCEFFCHARKIIAYNKICYHYCKRKDGLMNTVFADNLLHAQQRLLAEKSREVLAERLKTTKGIDIEPLYRGTLILAAIELLLNCFKGHPVKIFRIWKEYIHLPSVRRALGLS